MRYLKRYNETMRDELYNEIEELLANLLDEGFQVLTGRQSFGHNSHGILITLDKRSSSMPRLSYHLSPFDTDSLTFKWGDVRSEIERMIEYLGDRFDLRKTTVQKEANAGNAGIFGKLPGKQFDKMDAKFIRIEMIMK
jgi:hypothetical protein